MAAGRSAGAGAGQARTLLRSWPHRAKVEKEPLYTPLSSRWPTLSCTAPWSLAVISLLVHELRMKGEMEGWLGWVMPPAKGGADDASWHGWGCFAAAEGGADVGCTVWTAVKRRAAGKGCDCRSQAEKTIGAVDDRLRGCQLGVLRPVDNAVLRPVGNGSSVRSSCQALHCWPLCAAAGASCLASAGASSSRELLLVTSCSAASATAAPNPHMPAGRTHHLRGMYRSTISPCSTGSDMHRSSEETDHSPESVAARPHCAAAVAASSMLLVPPSGRQRSLVRSAHNKSP